MADTRPFTDVVNRGMIAGGLGAPVDFANLLSNALRAGAGYVGHKTGLMKADELPELVENPTGGSEWFGQKMQDMGMVSGERRPLAEAFAGVLGPNELMAGGKAATALAPLLAKVGKATEGAKTAETAARAVEAPYIQTSSTTTGKLLPREQGMYTPDVPQVDLPRQRGRGGKYNERMQDLLDSPTARKKVNELLRKGDDLGMREWYGTEPLRQAALGEGLSQGDFERMMGHLSSASQRNPVDKQNLQGSFLWHMDRSGQLDDPAVRLLTNKLRKAGDTGGPMIELPTGYGSLAQGAIFDRAKQIAGGNMEAALPPDKKLGTFHRNLLGNLRPVTVDVNAVRGPVIARGDPRWLETKVVDKDDEGKVLATHTPRSDVAEGRMSLDQAKDRPGFWLAAPEGSEYAGFEELWQRAAKRHGISPAEAQALGWYGSADVTALKTKPELYVDNLERLIRQRAQATGRRPTEVLKEFLSGKGHLAVGGIGAGLAAQQGLQDEPQ